MALRAALAPAQALSAQHVRGSWPAFPPKQSSAPPAFHVSFHEAAAMAVQFLNHREKCTCCAAGRRARPSRRSTTWTFLGRRPSAGWATTAGTATRRPPPPALRSRCAVLSRADFWSTPPWSTQQPSMVRRVVPDWLHHIHSSPHRPCTQRQTRSCMLTITTLPTVGSTKCMSRLTCYACHCIGHLPRAGHAVLSGTLVRQALGIHAGSFGDEWHC